MIEALRLIRAILLVWCGVSFVAIGLFAVIASWFKRHEASDIF